MLILMLSNTYVVKAEQYITNPATEGQAISNSMSLYDNGWYTGLVGLKVNIVPNSGIVKKDSNYATNLRGMIFNTTGLDISKEYVYIPATPAIKLWTTSSNIIDPNSGYWVKKNARDYVKTTTALPYTLNGINLKDELTKNSYKNLKQILTELFGQNSINSLKDDDFIIVEPMIKIGDYYGTAYELSYFYCDGLRKMCTKNFETNIASVVLWGKDNYQAGVMYATIYQEQSSYRFSGLSFVKAYYNASALSRKSEMFDKNSGAGLGIFKVSDVFNPNNGVLKIQKYIEGTNTKLDGAKFEVYSGSCSNKEQRVDGGIATDGELVLNLTAGTYCIVETKTPDGYSLDNPSYKEEKVNAGFTTTVKFYNTLTPQTGSLTIKKVNEDGSIITSDEAEFELYKGVSDCSTNKFVCDEYKSTTYYIWIPDTNCDNFFKYENYATEYEGAQVSFKQNGTGGVYCNVKPCKEGYPKKLSFTGSYTITGLALEQYSIKETKAPKDYEKDDTCYPVKLTASQPTKTKTITNKMKSCVSEFDALTNKNDMAKRLELYIKYSNQGDLRNLLNLDKITGVDACQPTSCPGNNTTGCLTGNYQTNTEFSARNLSCYNESTTDDNGNRVLCLTSFNLINNLGTSTWNVKSGQMAIQKTNNDNIAAIGTVTKKCYMFGNGSFTPGKYSNYVSQIEFGQTEDGHPSYLNSNDNDKNLTKDNSGSSGNFNVYSASVNYELKAVYSEVVTGKINSYGGLKYKFLGYGIISKWKATSSYVIPFSITFPHTLYGSSTYSSNSCQVIPIPEFIIPPTNPNDPYKLNLEFRIIDTENPFPGKTGTNMRLVGTNWRSQSVANYDISFRNQIESLKSNSIIFDKNLLSMYDLNKDGKINDKDLEIFDWRVSNYNNNEIVSRANNSYVAYIMSTTNNSYNKNKTEPKYKITLTPDIVKEIREYNKNNKYDDNNLKCNNGEDCTSTFIENLINNGVIVKK